jgi:hypothetical protein
MKFSLSKYTYITHKGVNKFGKPVQEIIAMSTYAGKPVKGVAKCDPKDSFDEGVGMELAAARCNAKIAAKRLKRAQTKHAEAVKDYEKAKKFLDKMIAYEEDAELSCTEALQEVKNLESEC